MSHSAVAKMAASLKWTGTLNVAVCGSTLPRKPSLCLDGYDFAVSRVAGSTRRAYRSNLTKNGSPTEVLLRVPVCAIQVSNATILSGSEMPSNVGSDSQVAGPRCLLPGLQAIWCTLASKDASRTRHRARPVSSLLAASALGCPETGRGRASGASVGTTRRRRRSHRCRRTHLGTPKRPAQGPEKPVFLRRTSGVHLKASAVRRYQQQHQQHLQSSNMVENKGKLHDALA